MCFIEELRFIPKATSEQIKTLNCNQPVAWTPMTCDHCEKIHSVAEALYELEDSF